MGLHSVYLYLAIKVFKCGPQRVKIKGKKQISHYCFELNECLQHFTKCLWAGFHVLWLWGNTVQPRPLTQPEMYVWEMNQDSKNKSMMTIFKIRSHSDGQENRKTTKKQVHLFWEGNKTLVSAKLALAPRAGCWRYS